jgi:hypothetical protein
MEGEKRMVEVRRDVDIVVPTVHLSTTTYAPEVKLRKELYILMFDIAKENRDKADEMSGKNQNEEIKFSMISILFSYTCLEAFINTIGKDKLDKDWHNYENNSTESKWMGVSKFLASKKYGELCSIFNKGKEPFSSFIKLEEIREDYLVHRKANFNQPVKTKYGNTEGIVNTLNSDAAKWACSVVRDMINTIVSNIDNPPSIDWLK